MHEVAKRWKRYVKKVNERILVKGVVDVTREGVIGWRQNLVAGVTGCGKGWWCHRKE